jgi:hypothetical protein
MLVCLANWAQGRQRIVVRSVRPLVCRHSPLDSLVVAHSPRVQSMIDFRIKQGCTSAIVSFILRAAATGDRP